MRGFFRAVFNAVATVAAVYVLALLIPGSTGVKLRSVLPDAQGIYSFAGSALEQAGKAGASLLSGDGGSLFTESSSSSVSGSRSSQTQRAQSSQQAQASNSTGLWGSTGIQGLTVYEYGKGLLDENGQAAYAKIAAAAQNVSPSVTVVGSMRPAELEKVYEYYLYDHAENFYLSGINMRYTEIGGIYTYVLTFQYLYGGDKARIVSMRTKMGAKALALLAQARKKSGALAQERALHDLLVQGCTYDSVAADNVKSSPAYSAYGALVNGKAVCQGYAQALKLLMSSAGIPSLYVSGEAANEEGSAPHAWNMAQVGGHWYYVDATFDDPVIVNASGQETGSQVLRHKYFNFVTSGDHSLGTFDDADPFSGDSENYATMPKAG